MQGKPSQTKAGIDGVGLLRAKTGSVKGVQGGCGKILPFTHSFPPSFPLFLPLSFAMGVELLFDGHCRLKYSEEKLGSSAVLLIYF